MGFPGIRCEALTNVVRARTLAGRIGNRGPLPRLVSKRDPRFRCCPRLSPSCFSSLSHFPFGPPPLPLWAPLVPLSIHPFAPLFSLTLNSAKSYLVLSHVRCAIAPLARWSCLPWCGRGGWVVSRPFPGAFPAVSQEGFNLPANDLFTLCNCVFVL